MHDEIIAHKRRTRRIAAVFAAFACVLCPWSGCESRVSAQQPACRPCPSCADKVNLSQLDAESRNRLKSELATELEREARARLTREIEAELRPQIEAEVRAKVVAEMRRNPPAVEPQGPDNPTEILAKPAPIPPTRPIEKDAGGLRITRHIFTTKVEHRQPVSDRDSFSISDSSVICYVEISSPESRDRTVIIRFTHSTGLAQSYSLPISQSPAWRTWAKLNLTRSMTGTWLCEVFNEDNVLLASRPFVVVD